MKAIEKAPWPCYSSEEGEILLSAERAADFSRTFVRGKCIITTARAAELSKLTYCDVNIALQMKCP